MGHVLKKLNRKSTSKLSKISATRNITIGELENTLYKPLSEFSWKDATRSEIHSEAISHYSKKFAL